MFTNYKGFPQPGDELIFKGIEDKDRFYPHFTNVIENAKKNLIPGRVYTVKKNEVHSSWCAVWLNEFGGEEDYFNLQMFYTQEVPPKLTGEQEEERLVMWERIFRLKK